MLGNQAGSVRFAAVMIIACPDCGWIQQMPPLRAGMSAEIAVDTGHARGLPHFLSAIF